MNEKETREFGLRFSNLTFEDFKNQAKDPSLSPYEKIGFPDSFREGKEQKIFLDILAKATNLATSNVKVLDIGPGCSDLPKLMLKNADSLTQTVTLIDSIEMLDLLPDGSNITKIDGMFPDCKSKLDDAKFHVIICYSVIQYIFASKNIFAFLEALIAALEPGGQALIGDIPNLSKRRRFLQSENGKKFHRAYMETDNDPKIEAFPQQIDGIDDTVIRALVDRANFMGCDAYQLPQNPELPMSNRRDDLLIIKP